MTAILTAEPTPSPQQPNLSKPARIDGIDIARAVALIGMFTVHVSVVGSSGETLGGAAGWWLTAPSGRASVLFMLLAGVSLSLIRGRGTASSSNGAIRRRGLVLLVGGLLLSTTVWSASILEHYGMLFLIAPWLLALRTRTLAVTTAAAIIAGPVLLLAAPAVDPTPPVGGPVTGWIAQTLSSLFIHGTYPLVVWFGVFSAGLLLGRLDLTSTRTAKQLLAGGIAAIAAVSVVVAGFSAVGFEPDGYSQDDITSGVNSDAADLDDRSVTDAQLDSMTEEELTAFFEKQDAAFDGFGEKSIYTGPADSPNQLLDTSPHSGRTAWLIQSLGIAAAILGLALMVRGLGRRFLHPLAMLGSISLTAYLVHILLVSDVFDAYIADSGFSLWAKFAALVGLQALLVVVAVGIRSTWRQGPFEWLLKQVTSRPAS